MNHFESEEDRVAHTEYMEQQYNPLLWDRVAYETGVNLTVKQIDTLNPETGSIYITQDIIKESLINVKADVVIWVAGMGMGKSGVYTYLTRLAVANNYILHNLTHSNALKGKAIKDTTIKYTKSIGGNVFDVTEVVCKPQTTRAKYNFTESSSQNSYTALSLIAEALKQPNSDEVLRLLIPEICRRYMIIDEAQQFVTNLLDCDLGGYRMKRRHMVTALQYYWQQILKSGGTIHLMDADFTLDGLLAVIELLGTHIDAPLNIRVNHFTRRRAEPRSLVLFEDARDMLLEAKIALEQGKRLLIHTATVQEGKSQFSAESLQSEFQAHFMDYVDHSLFPDIDPENAIGLITSRSIKWKDRPSFEALATGDNLRAYLATCAVCFVSPVMKAGISIDADFTRINSDGEIVPYFDYIPILASGSVPYESTSQASARSRAHTERWISFSEARHVYPTSKQQDAFKAAMLVEAHARLDVAEGVYSYTEIESNAWITRGRYRQSVRQYHYTLPGYTTGCLEFILSRENYELTRVVIATDGSGKPSLAEAKTRVTEKHMQAYDLVKDNEILCDSILALSGDDGRTYDEDLVLPVLLLEKRLDCKITPILFRESLEDRYRTCLLLALVLTDNPEKYAYEIKDLAKTSRASKVFVPGKAGGQGRMETFNKADADYMKETLPARASLIIKYGIAPFLAPDATEYAKTNQGAYAEVFNRINKNGHYARNMTILKGVFNKKIEPARTIEITECSKDGVGRKRTRKTTPEERGFHIVRCVRQSLGFPVKKEFPCWNTVFAIQAKLDKKAVERAQEEASYTAPILANKPITPLEAKITAKVFEQVELARDGCYYPRAWSKARECCILEVSPIKADNKIS